VDRARKSVESAEEKGGLVIEDSGQILFSHFNHE